MEGNAAMKLANAFSLNMVEAFPVAIRVVEISVEQASSFLRNEGVESVVGHSTTAALFSSLLGLDVPTNRATVVLRSEETMLVGQYAGPRLEEGVTTLPEGATVKWLLVRAE